MVMLSDYNEFAGRHWETGTIRNALAYQGVKAPHTGEPVSEALLLGISGGITVGYFTFEYEGYLPHIVLLTRNTFDPMETLLDRLAIPRDVRQTTSSDRGEENLRQALEREFPAIVWADIFSLPYNHLPYDERNWGVQPLLVYGIEGAQAYLADRANCPIVVSADVLHQARARIGKYRFRVMTLEAPNWDLLPDAVSNGIWQCIQLFTDAPSNWKHDNFGLAALQYWAKMLTNTRNKRSWARFFPRGERLWMALAGDQTQPGIYGWIYHGADNNAERGMYADFLREASAILDKPGLNEAAGIFRRSETAWSELRELVLPADVPLFKEAAELLTRKHTLFMEQGANASDAIQEANTRLTAIQQEVADHFSMNDAEVTAFREELAQRVLAIHDIERDAVACLQSIMA